MNIGDGVCVVTLRSPVVLDSAVLSVTVPLDSEVIEEYTEPTLENMLFRSVSVACAAACTIKADMMSSRDLISSDCEYDNPSSQ